MRSVRSERAVIEVGGDDADEWLQGQVTNDVRKASADAALYAFVLNEKGRIVADVEIVRRDGGFWLVVPRERLEALHARLERFVIMEDVDLKPRPDLTIVASTEDRPTGFASYAYARLGIAAHEAIVALENAPATDEHAWEILRAELGVPRFGVDFDDNLAQETGLADRAVSFSKGCYLGQESVVMLEHRGKLPRRVTRVRIEEGAPSAGAKLSSPEGADAGTLTTSIAGVATGLAMLKRDFLNAGTVLAADDARLVTL